MLRALLLVALAGAAAANLKYECGSGKIYEYDYSATVNASTRDMAGVVSDNGAHSQVKATEDTKGGLLVRCNSANATHFEMQMNIGNAVIEYEGKIVEVPGICTKPCDGRAMIDDDDHGGIPTGCCGEYALGDDVYFTQAVTGEVSTIRVSDDDSEYFVQIKLGAVNAFHTLIHPSATTYKGTEADVTGLHTTAFTSSASSISKSFTQTDVVHFADTTLQQHNVDFKGTGLANLHPTAGYIQGASFVQAATLVDISSTGATHTDTKPINSETDDDMSGFNAELHSAGEVFITEKPSGSRKYGFDSAEASYLRSKPTPKHRPVANLLHAARASMSKLQLKKSPSTSMPPNPARSSPGDEPFNKSWAASHHFGGSAVGADLAASAFAGTNLGTCNSTSFNYAAKAEAYAALQVFKGSWTPFYASIEYGKENGAALADQIVLQVFNKTVYQQAIKAADVDCSEHTHQLAHKAPGGSVKHTLWIGPIPLTLSASVAVDLSLEWGWHFCDDDLSADVYIKPAATISVTGSAELNLLVIDGTVSMEFAANTAVRPDLSVSGTKCDVGYEIDLVRSPADTASLHGFYKRMHCKYLFFDCKLEDAGDHTFWSWQAPTQTKVLANATWPIKL